VTSWRTGRFGQESEYLAFYNSQLDAVTTDPALMQIPFDDHMALRGHSVFDSCTVYNGQAYLLDRHIARLLSSAAKARIDLPLSAEQIKDKLLEVVASTQAQNCGVRLFLSAGPGNVMITPQKGASCLYMLVLVNELRHADIPNEATCRTPEKPEFLATMKSTNYLLNALTCMDSLDRGGSYGVCVDEEDQILESSIASVGFVLPGKRLVTPAFDRILRGVTMERVLELAQRLAEEGVLASVEQRSISLSEAKTCTEMFLTKADEVKSVLSWDDVVVGEGVRGPIASRLIELMQEDIGGGSSELTRVPYA
jgi:branched-subunit amino acid aminotransferase/4-amino-4-deoxychorismate lyase